MTRSSCVPDQMTIRLGLTQGVCRDGFSSLHRDLSLVLDIGWRLVNEGPKDRLYSECFPYNHGRRRPLSQTTAWLMAVLPLLAHL